VVRAHVTTAVPLSDEDQQAIADRLQSLTRANAIRMETSVDPAIIGGLVARVGDRLIDGSTRSRLIQLRKSLAAGGGVR
jgi:F-type H+-transporting ATPase subunit delta